MKKLLILSLLALSACKTLPYTHSAVEEVADEQDTSVRTQEQLYEVLTTDSLASIARRYDLPPQAIIERNRLKKPYILKPGQLLRIPPSQSESEGADGVAPPQSTSSRTVTIGPRQAS
jgi:LysM repeat protein